MLNWKHFYRCPIYYFINYTVFICCVVSTCSSLVFMNIIYCICCVLLRTQTSRPTCGKSALIRQKYYRCSISQKYSSWRKRWLSLSKRHIRNRPSAFSISKQWLHEACDIWYANLLSVSETLKVLISPWWSDNKASIRLTEQELHEWHWPWSPWLTACIWLQSVREWHIVCWLNSSIITVAIVCCILDLGLGFEGPGNVV